MLLDKNIDLNGKLLTLIGGRGCAGAETSLTSII